MRPGTYTVHGTDERNNPHWYWIRTSKDCTRDTVAQCAIDKAAQLDNITFAVQSVQFEWGSNKAHATD